jgi:heat shock protein HslJ
VSDDLTHEINLALADLEWHAPPAPALRDIRAGGPVRLTAEPSRHWTAILFAAAAATVLVVGVATLVARNVGSSPTVVDEASTTSTTAPLEDPLAQLMGTWTVTSVTVRGTTTTIDAAAFIEEGRTPPQVTVFDDHIRGFSGCNDFAAGGPIGVAGGVLTIGGYRTITAVGCPEADVIAVEGAIWAVLGGEVQLEVSQETMVWSASDIEISFTRVDARSLAILPSWPMSVGRLDCGSDAAVTVDVPGEGSDAATVLRQVPGVVSIEGEGVPGTEDGFVWGLDESGTVIAGTAAGGVQPPVFHLSACAPSLGIRPGADLTGAVGTWVNRLGLGQTSASVWSGRFVELCTAQNDSQLRDLAVDVVNEHLSGATPPTPDDTMATLQVLRAAICKSST